MNPTNLTDEGLRRLATKIAFDGISEGRPSTIPMQIVLITNALQQVRDAAKKEGDEKIAIAFAEGERIGIERVRVLAWGLIKNDKLDTAIRQMDGGK